ncbi:MAG: DNA alkylation repair protein [Bacteroidales bacterium]|jgi:3-methyladenine DNA glycosylase AlkD|nr:DNA alkylation repair protein [Bacteroidales bacterium]MCI1785858.1 DNA alkylation repair protein [Bacteroidales bacterium]
MNIESGAIIDELKAVADHEKSAVLSRFFKTGKGEYGEGDKFLGITVPEIRKVSSRHKNASEADLSALLESPFHEIRMCALLIIVEQCKILRSRKWISAHSVNENETELKKKFDFYLGRTAFINNWDLVDLSCPAVIGEYLEDKPHDILYDMASSDYIWNRRIAIVSTLAFIRNGETDDTFSITELLLEKDTSSGKSMHDLIQKASGWMLREAGKRDEKKLLAFLDSHAEKMPRTMLRYSLEKLGPDVRGYYMGMANPRAKTSDPRREVR